MISRLTAAAAIFSVVTAASLAYATTPDRDRATTPNAAVKQVRVVQLERVVITAKRSEHAPR